MTFRYYVLTGPTASGKTAWLVNRARTRRLLAISADSRQVYRHLDIGTGKPTLADRQILPHQGIDCLEFNINFSAYQFLTIAAQGLALAEREGREPWICGGTGLYIRALIEGMSLGLPPRPRLRAAIEQRLARQSAAELAAQLGLSLADPHNPVRVARYAELACTAAKRAREIYARLGLDPELVDGEGQPNAPAGGSATAVRDELARWRCGGLAVLDPGTELAARIAARTQGMFDSGLVDEVAHIRHLGGGDCAVVRDGIGYREAGQVLGGELALPAAVERTIIRTRQYAKRQRTYFRGQGWACYDQAGLEQWAAEVGCS